LLNKPVMILNYTRTPAARRGFFLSPTITEACENPVNERNDGDLVRSDLPPS
jgi:hypothetical protein